MDESRTRVGITIELSAGGPDVSARSLARIPPFALVILFGGGKLKMKIELINRGMIQHYAAEGATLRDCHGRVLTEQEAIDAFMLESDDLRPVTADDPPNRPGSAMSAAPTTSELPEPLARHSFAASGGSASFRVLWWDDVARRHSLLECVGINHPTPEAAADAARRYGIESFRVVDELGNRAEL